MNKLTLALTAIILSTTLASAELAAKMEKGKETVKKPIHCPTAQGDIRMLENEKKEIDKKTVSGIFSITPIGILTNVATTNTESEKIDIEKYKKMLDKKIAQIEKACHVKYLPKD